MGKCCFCHHAIGRGRIYVVAGMGFETNPFADAFLPVKFFPLLLLGCVGLCIILYVVEYLTQGYSGDDKDGMVFDDFGGLVRTLLTIVFTIAAYFVWRMKGFDVALPWQDTTMRVPALLS